MFQMPNQPSSPISVVFTGFRLWKNSFWHIAFLSFIVVAIGTIPNFVFPELNKSTFERIVFRNEHWQWYLLATLITLYFFSVILHIVYKRSKNDPTTFAQSFWHALMRYPPLILASFAFVITVSIASVFLIIPGFVLMVYLTLYYVVIIIENKNFIEGYKASIKYVLGNWWRTLAVSLFTLLLFTAITEIIAFFSEDVWLIAHPSGGHIKALKHLLLWILGVLYFPLLICVLVALYHDLKIRFALKNQPNES